MKSVEIRKKFLDFFAKKNHTVVPSSATVPANDPTLLFTNAGMVQFKDVFLGAETRPYKRAASAQRCIRAGGKHNDLDNVGYTARHHTFFEMLGNFSFGDYFKEDAIKFAWEFLTVELKLPKEKLWVTVFKDDDEAADIWTKQIGVPSDRVIRLGEKSNFWAMGDTGPCGPCTEIFYDHGADVAGGPPGSPDEDGDRYIEIWNIVFMQFNRSKDGVMTPLPKPSVDTGMGIERLAAVLQGVHNNYDTDIFKSLKQACVSLLNDNNTKDNARFNVIADHIRSCSFLIADGVIPSNEGRGYVLRRIIRRAVRHGHKLGLIAPFFYKLVPALVKEMGEAYPELIKAQAQIERLLKQEEEQFMRTLDQGLQILETEIAKLTNTLIPGSVIFKLYDTYGFPVDLTGDIARERDLQLDLDGFEAAMAKQRAQSQASSQFGVDYNTKLTIQATTDFTGYEQLAHEAMIVALYKNNQSVDTLESGEEGIVLLDRTPFYAESGGQVGDIGYLKSGQNNFKVHDTQKSGQAHLHHGHVEAGVLRVGDKLSTQVDAARRQAIRLNHTATHLLHAALQKIVGTHVQQKGSLVDSERLRFDFAHFAPLTEEELQNIEVLVNQQIRANAEGITRVMSPDAAKAAGAMALFGEKYGDQVRVLNFGDFSMELCGGTHAARTGDIGLFKIVEETGIAAGVRRIEAVTGEYAFGFVETAVQQLQQVAKQLKASRESVVGKVDQLLSRQKELEKEIERLKAKVHQASSVELMTHVEKIKDVSVLIATIDDADAKSLRVAMDQLRTKLSDGIIVLTTIEGDKVTILAAVAPHCVDRVKAGELVNHIAMQVGGKGGGRPDLAQAGGTEPAKLPEALKASRVWLAEKL